MALSVPKAPGVAQMMKDGARVSKIQNFHSNACSANVNHVPNVTGEKNFNCREKQKPC